MLSGAAPAPAASWGQQPGVTPASAPRAEARGFGAAAIVGIREEVLRALGELVEEGGQLGRVDADLAPRLRDAARRLHRRQQLQQGVGVQRWAVVLADVPTGLQGDAQHGGGPGFMQ